MLILPLGPEEDDLRGVASEHGVATYTLLGLCGLVFLFCVWSLDGPGFVAFLARWGFDARRMLDPGLFTHLFVHGDGLHLLGNGVFLLLLGITVERKLGPLALLTVFFVSGLCGAWVYGLTVKPLLVETATGPLRVYPPLVGASGAIMGLVGCLLPTDPTLRIRVLFGFHLWWRVVAVPAWLVAGLFFVKEFLAALSQTPGTSTAYAAHLGGLVGGACVAYLLPPLHRIERRLQERVHETLGSHSVARLAPDAFRAPLAASLPGEWIPGAEAPVESGRGPSPSGIGEVPEHQDLHQVSGVWAPSWQLADLQDRFQRARRMERGADRARLAFGFYLKVLRDEELPPGYRAFAGARACRMLLRARRFQAADRLAGKLLANELAPDLEEHVRETRRHARRMLARERARREAPGLT